MTGARTGSLALLIVLACVPGAEAQATRNGPEWGGKNHQPTRAQVTRREDNAGVQPSPAQASQNGQAVDQLGQQLLHDEAVDPPRNPNRPVPR